MAGSIWDMKSPYSILLGLAPRQSSSALACAHLLKVSRVTGTTRARAVGAARFVLGLSDYKQWPDTFDV